MDVQRFQLANGIWVATARTVQGAPVSLQVWLSFGTRAETDAQDGLVHFNEHMFFKGGRDFPDMKSVERELRLLGDRHNAHTGDEFVFYYITTSAGSFRRAAHLLSDMLIHARMDPADVEKERGAILQELNRLRDNPEDFAGLEYVRFLFGDHPLGRTGLGTKTSTAGFSADDIRAYKERFYGPPNMVISAAGGIDFAEARALLEEYFGGISAKEKVSWLPFQQGSVYPPAKLLIRKGIEQAHLHLGAFGPSLYSPDIRAAGLLAEVLSNRLWLKIRMDEALAYSVFSFMRPRSDVGEFMVYAGVDSEIEAVVKTLSAVFQEMRDLKDGNISEEEIADSKICVRGQFDLTLESAGMVAAFLGGNELYFGRQRSVEEIHAEIERPRKEDLVRLANEMWKEEAVRSLLLTTSFPDYENKFLELRRMLGR